MGEFAGRVIRDFSVPGMFVLIGALQNIQVGFFLYLNKPIGDA